MHNIVIIVCGAVGGFDNYISHYAIVLRSLFVIEVKNITSSKSQRYKDETKI